MKKIRALNDYPQTWALQVDQCVLEIAIKYTRRRGSVALKYQNGNWVFYCPQNLAPQKIASLLKGYQADFEHLIVSQQLKSAPSNQIPSIATEFSWLGEMRSKLEFGDSLERVLIGEAQQYFTEKVPYYATQMRLQPKQIKVKSYQACWGNCYHQRGLLQFNWKLLQAPSWVVDYVIVHELAHLVHPNHSTDFWSLVHRHYPQTPQAKRYLKENGQRMMHLAIAE
ncbi:hypothetical protein THMIRHAS_19520 [Thiosulfatimonas sediminis]|uniref:YgjP-like metallopeptidase domain-containing protein n=1 Tax=Thiosulfatimonas sediminis TaxID=2675054 RepID=A0A6F8PWT1_9GAMM|nr:M48 family metallopeptidase [Thiosulfatimonas sediminis]BBP46579.1 hypothetical protein THMIRHAS_19520 [Thiosulfatimonas sediminis]